MDYEDQNRELLKEVEARRTEGVDYEILDMWREEDGQLRATVRYASGLEVIRSVGSVKVKAKVIRADESIAAGLSPEEDLGVIAATYSNPATETRSRLEGVGSVTVQERPAEVRES